MSDIKLNDSHDIEIVNNDLVLITGLDYKVQKLKQNLKMFLGEWFLDTSLGIPYLQEIYAKIVDAKRVDAVFKEAILNTEDVIELLTFELDLGSNRELSLNFSVRFDEGVAEIEGI